LAEEDTGKRKSKSGSKGEGGVGWGGERKRDIGIHGSCADVRGGAGARLLHLLDILGVSNVCVVVSRWYGNTSKTPFPSVIQDPETLVYSFNQSPITESQSSSKNHALLSPYTCLSLRVCVRALVCRHVIQPVIAINNICRPVIAMDNICRPVIAVDNTCRPVIAIQNTCQKEIPIKNNVNARLRPFQQ